MVEKLGHNIKEDMRLVVASDIKGTVCYFRDSDLGRLVKGDHAALPYWEARELESGGHTCIN